MINLGAAYHLIMAERDIGARCGFYGQVLGMRARRLDD